MKPSRLFGAVALAALCAPGAAQAQQQPAPDAVELAGGPARNWWQLDPQADNVRGISAVRAYRELLTGKQPRRTVVVAIIDSGVEVDHPDLKDVIWTNPREVAGNGRDDDNNGFVDDVHGWDFIGGRDGRDVVQDTYESTRLYAQLRKYQNANRDTLSPAAQAEFDQYREIRAKWEADRAEAQGMVQQIRQVSAAVDRMVALLKQEARTDSLTPARVTAIQSSRPDVQQAKNIFLQLAAQGITPERIAEERKSLEGRLEYGLNPDFDPRNIVGDNYADPRERGYGNAEVEGPDALHGTHVAGIVGAVRGNGVGVDGVSNAVRIMVLRTVPDGDERDKDVANAIRYAADNGAQVINMSFGKAFSPQKDVVDEAVRYAESKGVLLVHAAGNDGADLEAEPSYPTRDFRAGGTARNWIEVGASTWSADSLAASFSNWSAKKVDVFAPGASILSTIQDAGYERNDGTSMAAPVVSGIAATIMAYYPTLTAEQVKAIILESARKYPDQVVARPGGSDGETVRFGQLSATGGVVNLYDALRLAEQRAGARR